MTDGHIVDKWRGLRTVEGMALALTLAMLVAAIWGGRAVSDCHIDYVCVAPTHLASKDSSDTLVHQESWAYCHAGVLRGHEWRRIAPTTIQELRRHSEAREPVSLA